MNPTPKQTEAIETRNKSLLVSAGAGSGKTTVLTRRLIERIKAGDSVTDFLVVTFMKAAAADIKRKLYDALLEESARDPQNKHVYRQLLLVSEANICTISSYCLSLVKENFALLGISPKARVIDETEESLLLRRIADELIAKGYNEEDKDFLLLADNFSSAKSDEPLINAMLNLYNTLRVTLDRKEVLKSCAESLERDAEITEKYGYFETENGKELKARLVSEYDEILVKANEMFAFAASVATSDKYLAPIDAMVSRSEEIRLALDKGYSSYCAVAVKPYTGMGLSGHGCDAESREVVKAMKKEIVDVADKLGERYCRGDDAFIAAGLKRTAEIVTAIDRFIDELENGYEAAKAELGVLDFSDYEKKALILLETTNENGNKVPSELCLKKQRSFKEILIDEYQDVNPMQDRIFTLLAGGSYRFMVGDVKQSIYRFRNAYPDIFLGYKELYPDLSEDKNGNTGRIFLRENFRCAQTVIDYVNHLFKSITINTPYYREYDNEWLIHASSRPERNHPVVIAVSEKERGQAKEARTNEAEYIAREIVRLVSTECADDGSKLKFSDFAIMLNAMKGYSIEYEKAFRKYNIPYKSEKSENFLENPDIRLAVASLKAIDDPTDDISLCAFMRSPICRFSSNELYRIRLKLPRTAFWHAVARTARLKRKKASKGRFKASTRKGEHCLAVKCRRFVRRMHFWRSECAGVPCREFLKGFFVTSGLLHISADSGNKQSMLMLYDIASKYESAYNYGLSGFLDYLSELSGSGSTLSDVAGSGDEDAVSFITVHKSKGLEFKVCFLACADRRFGGSRNDKGITYIRREGIYFNLVDRSRFVNYDPMCNIIAMDKERVHAVGEELRKIYVALTRAKERLYITGCADKGFADKAYRLSDCNSCMDYVLYTAQLGEKAFFTVSNILEADGNSGYIPPKERKIITPTEETLRVASYVYPYANATKTMAKVSVSELREGLLEDDEYNRTVLSVPVSRVAIRPSFAEKEQKSAADIGTANHLFMQFCDFDNVIKNGVAAEAERLLSIKMIDCTQRDMLDVKALEDFFDSKLFKRITASPRVYREKRFSVRDVLVENNEPVLVQGVIDCFFENPDGSFTVVDYKTDRVGKPEELVARHRIQLACYKRAVERMTGRAVSKTLLYSFALGCEVEADV